jgi:type II secretory pathway pseudopilin PulG
MTARTVKGATIIECLVASIIVAVGIMGVMALWGFSMDLTVTSDERAVAYNVVRRSIERVKSQGFKNAPEGTSVLYYDASGGGESASRGSLRYSATIVVTSSAYNTGTTNPADNSIRTVVTTVRRLSDNKVLEIGGTYLVRGGL